MWISPVVFSIYVDNIIERLRMSGYGCVIGGEFFGCKYFESFGVCG